MTNKYLKVYVKNDLAGYLYYLENGKLSFEYIKEYKGQPLSVTMNDSSKKYEHDIVYAFFENLLAEGDVREITRKLLSIDKNNIFNILSEVGGDCAGIISLYKPEDEYQKYEETPVRRILVKPKYLPEELDQVISDLNNNCINSSDFKVMSNIAGVQQKRTMFVVRRHKHDKDYDFYKNIIEAPTTAIVKVNGKAFDNLVYNEHFCMQLSTVLGMDTALTNVLKTQTGVPFLLVARYDRNLTKISSNFFLTRLWQMDFCQLTNRTSRLKYQRENNGQGVSISEIYNLLAGTDKIEFIKSVIFNYLVGNNDAHGKNYSILEHKENYRLAPLYDLVATQVYWGSRYKMAMKIGGEYDHNKIRYRHFYKLAEELNLSKKFMAKTIDAMTDSILKKAYAVKEDLIAQDLDCSIYDKIIAVIDQNSNTLKNSKQYAE